MTRTYTSELPHHIGETVALSGWLHRLRRLRQVSFLILRDRTGFAQIVIEDPVVAALVDQLPPESVLQVTGVVQGVEQAPQGVEIHQPTVKVISPALEPPAFDLFRPDIKAQLPTQLDHAPVALRHVRLSSTWKLAASAMAGFRETLMQQQFTEIQTPKIVASATESGANVFSLDYFGTPAYLAQSPQFYKQIMVGVYERVFEVGPVFRAEPHATTRHLAQYTSLDVEMGFIEDHRTIMGLLTQVIRDMLERIQRDNGPALSHLSVEIPTVPAEIPSIHFREAHTYYFEATGEDVRGEPDLSPAEERWLGQWAQQTYGSAFLFVTGYPMLKRPFYTHPDPAQPTYSNSFDLLFRGVELVTGGQRLHRYEDYLHALEQRGLKADLFQEYLQAFKHGMPPHGGFAIGLERFIAQLIGAKNVREVALFPRDMARLTP
ncbi:MAG: aspartate--tRNA(Asn) ligase [Anaerolineae bacterium]